MWRGLVLGLLLYSSVLNAGSPPVSMSAAPHTGFTPVDLRITVTLPRDEQNRVLCLVADSEDGMSVSSCKDIEGAKAPTLHTQYFKHLTTGTYAVYARLLRADRSEYLTSPITVVVLGP